MSKKNKDAFIEFEVNPLRIALRKYFENIAIGQYDWEGFDRKAIPVRYPERWLYENGSCVYFKYKNEIPMILPVALTNITKNVYGEPAEWRAIAIGDMSVYVNNIKFNNKNSVLIRNDALYSNSKSFVDYMVEQMINVELTTRLNVNANKMPFIFKGDFETGLQNKNTFLELMECRPVQFKDKNNLDEFEVLYNEVPLLSEDLTKLYDVYQFRTLSYLGVSSLQIEKRERMLVDEVNTNQEEQTFMKNARLEQRKIACDEIKDIFGETITVKFKEVELNARQKAMLGAQGFGNENRDDKGNSE